MKVDCELCVIPSCIFKIEFITHGVASINTRINIRVTISITDDKMDTVPYDVSFPTKFVKHFANVPFSIYAKIM